MVETEKNRDRLEERDVYRRSASGVAWFALILGVLSLIVAILAFNRSGRDLNTTALERINNWQAEFDRREDIAESRIRLAILGAKIQAGQSVEDSQRELNEIRNDLRESYTDASGRLDRRWNEINENFNTAERQIRDRSSDVLRSIENLIERIREDVRTDEP